jgi:hypothetical protein
VTHATTRLRGRKEQAKAKGLAAEEDD